MVTSEHAPTVQRSEGTEQSPGMPGSLGLAVFLGDYSASGIKVTWLSSPQGCPVSLCPLYVGCLSLGSLEQFSCLVISGKWEDVREGGRKVTGALRGSFQGPCGQWWCACHGGRKRT